MIFRTAVTGAARTARTLAILSTITNAAAAQDLVSRGRTLEIRVPSGSFIATGAQGNQLKDTHLTALQLSWVVRPHLAVTGTFAWARSRDLATAGKPRLDVFTSDLGLEARSAEWSAGKHVSLSTFAGIGGGARSYDYVKRDARLTNNLAGYVAAGGELGVRRVALRIEARNYTTGFKPLVGAGKSETRHDMVVMAAVRINRRSPEAR
jgi:hypothetical protein